MNHMHLATPASFARRPLALAVSLALLALPGLATAQSDTAATKPIETTLPTVTITGSSTRETATSPVTGYSPKRTATATKTDTPLAETPQSVTVVTRDQMQDQRATSLQDALLYGAGVRADNYGVDSRGDWVRVRGSEPVQYLDGLQMFFGYNNSSRPDPYTLERVDVLRGPSSVLFGQGSTGGVINMTSKRPQADTQGEIDLAVGSFNRRQVQGDFTGALDERGEWLYRIVGVARKADTQVDYVPDDRLLLAPSLTWRPGTATSLTLQAHWQEDDSGSSATFLPFSGTALPNPNGQIPTNRFIGEPGWDRFDTTRKSLGYLFEHRFNTAWAVRQNLRYTASTGDYQSLYPGSNFSDPYNPYLDPSQRIISRYSYVNKRDTKTLVADQHAEGKFNTGTIEHRILLGVDHARYSETAMSGAGFEPAFDIYAPVYGNFTPPTLSNDPDVLQRQTGVYAQDQIKLTKNWQTMFGLRHDRVSNVLQNAPTEKDKATTKRVALMYVGDSGWSPYLSYSESFLPVAGLDFYNQRYIPTRGVQNEIGVKYQPANSPLVFNAAVYDLREKNRQIPDPNNALNQVQSGSTKTRGLELELKTRIGKQFDLLAHYDYTDIDAALEAVPQHQATLWGKLRFALADMPGFSAGLGLRYASSFRDGSGPEVEAHTLVDALLAYETPHWRYALNANNLTDKTYLSTCLRRGDCWYGARRNIQASVSYRY